MSEWKDVTRWGVYDTHDDCWLGDEHGPKLFGESAGTNGLLTPQVLARIAAQIAGVQMGYDLTRLEARPFPEGQVRFRDAVDTQMTPREALDAIENGQL